MSDKNQEMFLVTIGNREKEYPTGTSYGEILDTFPYEEDYVKKGDFVLAFVNGKLQELFKRLKGNAVLRPLTTAEPIGMDTYERGLTFMLVKAVYDILGKDVELHVEFALGRGMYCNLAGYDQKITKELIDQLKTRMQEMSEQKLPFFKSLYSTSEVRKIFHDFHQFDKEKLFRYRLSSYTSLYELDGYLDYYYGYMPANTSTLKVFDLLPYDDGMMLLFPSLEDPYKLAPVPHLDKLYGMLKEADQWGKMAGVDTVGDLNELLVSGMGNNLVLVQESMQERKISEIAKEIVSDSRRKFVLIAGPSSSGKTSFANRMAVQLMTLGKLPHLISCDNYFKNREDYPVDENGEVDYESVDTVDTDLLNQDLRALLEGKEVEIPSFNFLDGKREYKGEMLQLGKSDILIIEGIHMLNDKVTRELPRENKFKIYISALITLNIDAHNRIPTTIGRLIRRMERDARTRGESAADTIARWSSVRRGEERNIFPYQETADAMFNSSMIYELSVEKQYCERLLYSVPEDSVEYQTAKRLLKAFSYLLGMDADAVPSNSLVREFIGGSCFNVG